jgi:hypothetical protein
LKRAGLLLFFFLFFSTPSVAATVDWTACGAILAARGFLLGEFAFTKEKAHRQLASNLILHRDFAHVPEMDPARLEALSNRRISVWLHRLELGDQLKAGRFASMLPAMEREGLKTDEEKILALAMDPPGHEATWTSFLHSLGSPIGEVVKDFDGLEISFRPVRSGRWKKAGMIPHDPAIYELEVAIPELHPHVHAFCRFVRESWDADCHQYSESFLEFLSTFVGSYLGEGGALNELRFVTVLNAYARRMDVLWRVWSPADLRYAYSHPTGPFPE